jgi:carboxymethylenebutenolidase
MTDRDPILLVPPGDGPHPGVVLGAEAYGVNEFILEVAERLVAAGYAVLVPDYYRGTGPTDPENYDDFTEVIESIGHLDFTDAARVLADGIDRLRRTPGVDPARVAVWGYCTGGTLAWLAACQRGDLAAAVLFFPSQPQFAELGPATPVHPVDLLWMLTCPTLFIYGDEDQVMPSDLLADVRERIARWSVPAEVRIYQGAGHAFTVPRGPMRHEPSATAAWADATQFLDAQVRNSRP